MKVFNELQDIQNLAKIDDPLISTKIIETISFGNKEYPIISFSIGSNSPDVPVFGIFAGVHGLERVGTHLAITYLNNLFSRLSWDFELRESFKNFRIVSIPLINPAGMDLIKRSNANGVDLMRNAPVESDAKKKSLLSGHRISPLLPWYRGADPQKMEQETLAVIKFCQEQMLNSKFSMSIDLHSGFGLRDRLWYPFARTKNPFPLSYKIEQLERLLNKTLPHHIYKIEQQSDSYTTSGDLWDYIFDVYWAEKTDDKIFIPLTLELGSWLWVKKNPLQIFSILGLFNPIRKHRFDRVMRRHLLLFDFLGQAIKNHKHWSSQ